MADTTTVRVQTSTRGLVLQIGASRRQSADQVILAALAAMQRDERRQVAAAEARAMEDDPADRAEVRAIQHDTPALHEGSGLPTATARQGPQAEGAPVCRGAAAGLATLSSWIVAFTSASAPETSFRPSAVVADRQTLVMCDQFAAVDLNHLTEPVAS